MNIALIGSGGREHALSHKLYQSSINNNIYCIPGNAGTSKFATNIDMDFLNFKLLLKVLKILKISLVIVGPEEPLVNGIVDFLEKNKIKVFGPNKYASQLEGSKAFMKSLCKKYNIPTAKFKICQNSKDVINFLKTCKLPVVVKADGLAAGKGVTICKSLNHVRKTTNEIFLGKFKTSKKAVLEEFLQGEEASYFLIVDKNNFKFFGVAQDHKKVGENEKGLNTGGMGAYSPIEIINTKIEKKIITKIVKPTLQALKNRGEYYRGFLYVGLMIKNGEPFLIEYNVRMGDPECQVILPRLKTDLLKIINFSLKNKLNKIKIEWKKKKCMTVVLCSKGYPKKYKKNLNLNNLSKIKNKKNRLIFHAGTKKINGEIKSSGGRIINVTVLGNDFKFIRKKIHNCLKIINLKNSFYRKDIGWRVIK